MTTSPNRQAVIVGLFVTAGLAILGGGVLTIGDLNDTFTKKITVSAVFDGVNGLKVGDNIWFSGLKVGTVKDLTFEPDSKVRAELDIDRAATPFIHNDVLVKIGSDGLIGNRIVVIYEGTLTAPTIKEGDILNLGDAVSTEEMMAMLQKNNENLLAITTDIKSIVAEIQAGEGTIGRLLKEDGLYTDVTATVAELRLAADNARNLTRSLATFSADLNKPGQLPHDLVNDQTSYAELTASVDSLRKVGERATEIVDGLAVAVASETSPIGVVLNDREAGSDLRETLDRLNQATVLLNEDLKAIQSNFLFRPYFRKQERAAAKAARAAGK